MDNELQQLKDIHLPHAISSWSIAPGWIILFLIFVGFISYLIYFGYQRNRKTKTIKFALSKLKKLQDLNVENPENINIAAEISTLIRRTALHYFPREKIASISGNEWLDFLNRSGNTSQFNEKTGHLLIHAPYRNNEVTDLAPLFDITQNWLVTIARKKRLFTEI